MHIDIHKRTKIMSKAIICNGYYKNILLFKKG